MMFLPLLLLKSLVQVTRNIATIISMHDIGSHIIMRIHARVVISYYCYQYYYYYYHCYYYYYTSICLHLPTRTRNHGSKALEECLLNLLD